MKGRLALCSVSVHIKWHMPCFFIDRWLSRPLPRDAWAFYGPVTAAVTSMQMLFHAWGASHTRTISVPAVLTKEPVLRRGSPLPALGWCNMQSARLIKSCCLAIANQSHLKLPLKDKTQKKFFGCIGLLRLIDSLLLGKAVRDWSAVCSFDLGRSWRAIFFWLQHAWLLPSRSVSERMSSRHLVSRVHFLS